MRNALSVDVEDYFHASALEVPGASWDLLEHRVSRNTEALLALFADADTKATFFVLGWVAERYPGLLRQIALQGHEIACHGYSHRRIFDQSPDEFTAETRKAKSLLEDITGRAVTGYRAASFSVTAETLWALEVLHDLGFEYDSSIAPIHHASYGIPDAALRPHCRMMASGGMLIEVPPAALDLGAVRVPVGGGAYFRLWPYAFTRLAIRSINRRSEPFVFYLHPWEIDPEQPRVATHVLSRCRHYFNLSRTQARLRRMLDDFDFEPISSMLTRMGFSAPGQSDSAQLVASG